MKHLTVTFGVLLLLLLVVIGCLLSHDSSKNYPQDSTNYFGQSKLSLKITNHVDCFSNDNCNTTSQLILEFERQEAVNGSIEEKYYSIMMIGNKKKHEVKRSLKPEYIDLFRRRTGELSVRLISTLDTNAYWFWNVFFTHD